jgi:hypothetical protein
VYAYVGYKICGRNLAEINNLEVPSVDVWTTFRGLRTGRSVLDLSGSGEGPVGGYLEQDVRLFPPTPPPPKCTKFLKEVNIYWLEECVHLGCDVTSPVSDSQLLEGTSAAVWIPGRIYFSRTFVFEEEVQSFETSGTDYPVT